MKKYLFISVMCIATLSVHAQHNINSDGDVAIKGGFMPGYALSVVAGKNPIIGLHENGTGNWANGIEGHTRPTGTTKGAGLVAAAFNKSNDGTQGRYYGVLAQAGYATSGYNYGVFGQLYDTQYNGAGIYGTVYSTESGMNVGGRYAGFFNGAVKVVGNLTVTGNISGVVVGSSSSNSAKVAQVNVVSSNSLATQLQGLTANTFYIERPNKPLKAKNAGGLQADTLEMEIPLTAMEEQVLKKRHYGLSAEQLEEAFPDLVYENEDGSKSINYVEMVPILVQALNELNEKVAALEKGSAMMHKEGDDLSEKKVVKGRQIILYP